MVSAQAFLQPIDELEAFASEDSELVSLSLFGPTLLIQPYQILVAFKRLSQLFSVVLYSSSRLFFALLYISLWFPSNITPICLINSDHH